MREQRYAPVMIARPAEFQVKQATGRKVTFMERASVQNNTNHTAKDEETEPHTEVHNLLRGFVEGIQDVIVLGLCIVLFLIMARALWDLGLDAINEQVNVRDLISQVLFVTVLVEVYRLLILYLREHRVAVDTVVEITLVSGLREVVLHGVTEIAWERLLAVSAFVLCLGVLLRFAIHRLPERNRPGRKGFWNHREIKQKVIP